MLKEVTIDKIIHNDAPKFIKTTLVEAKRDGKSFCWEMTKVLDSVHVSVFNETTDEFLLVKQVRVPVLVNDPVSKGEVVEVCAGLVDKNLPVKNIAKEEILEELGYDADIQRISFIKTIKSSVGTSGANAHLFHATVSEDIRISDGGGINNEEIEVVRIHKNEIEQYMFESTTDAVSMLLLTFHMLLVCHKS